MNNNSKSILAKLLAKENITVQHGNYQTAYFDVDNRVLGLPYWKEMSKDVYDLMIGHEVGHALETPVEGWHNSKTDIPNCPRAFVNVIEDIRIEKHIQRRYPGLISIFKRGYAQLNAMNFFEIEGKDVDRMSFMNRLNLKTKLRDLIDISFTTEEQPYVDMAMAVETWDDVINCCRKIYDYLKAKEDEQKRNEPENKPGQGLEGGSGGGESGLPENQSTESGEPDNQNMSDDLSNADNERDRLLDSIESKQDSASDSTMENQSVNETPNEKKYEVMDVSTDDAYHSKEIDLVELNSSGAEFKVIRGLNRDQLNDMLISYSTLSEMRKQVLVKEAELSKIYESHYGSAYASRKELQNTDLEYKEFLDETTKIVGVMAKEFEMRKSAYQYLRAKTSRSGSLNVNKLHEYRFNDDIFRKVTKLADAKSHGMIMYIDRSSSMSNIFSRVVRQVLSLAMFCKKVGIPFDVYTYTSFSDGHANKIFGPKRKYRPKAYEMDHRNIVLCQVLSSSLTRGDYDIAFRELFNQTCNEDLTRMVADCEMMGSTPTNEVLTAVPMMLQDFKNKHGVQKIIVPILTDGEAGYINYMRCSDNNEVYSYNLHSSDFIIDVGGTYIRCKGAYNKTSANLTEHIRKLGVKTIGYYLANNSYEFKTRVALAADNWSREVFIDASKLNRVQKFVSYDNTLGYDRYFIIKTSSTSLSTELDEFEVREGAKSGEITRAFKKYTTSKKTNRLLAAQFAEIIS